MKDHFGNTIEVGDRFFYYETVGRVIRIRRTSLMMETGADKYTNVSTSMNVKSPFRGICLDKNLNSCYECDHPLVLDASFCPGCGEPFDA